MNGFTILCFLLAVGLIGVLQRCVFPYKLKIKQDAVIKLRHKTRMSVPDRSLDRNTESPQGAKVCVTP